MRYVDEYRDPGAVARLTDALRRRVTRPWVLMEVCGGQTHAILRSGIDRMLPEGLTLVHGPGCPVCVTPVERIDQAVALAGRPEVILTSFGDMLRVPGSAGDLLAAKARGGSVRLVYSPLDAVALAQQHPDRQVVFFAVGFETTAPTAAAAVVRAKALGLANFTLLSAHVRVAPAMAALLAGEDNRVQAFLAAGHVATVMGIDELVPVGERFRVPIVVTGFEPVDLLLGVEGAVAALEEGRHGVENAYARSVRPEGNPAARRLLDEVFVVCDREWRGFGTIPASGYALAPAYADFDAERRFDLAAPPAREEPDCRAGQVLRGVIRPTECPAFGGRCTPDHPLGAPMVSSEGACAAYHRYARSA